MTLLRRFPNLKTLCISIKTLTLTNMAKMGAQQQTEDSYGDSILACLKKVEITYSGGSKSELDLVNFLLGNGAAMEEMSILYSKHKKAEKGSNEKLAAFTRASPKVVISVP